MEHQMNNKIKQMKEFFFQWVTVIFVRAFFLGRKTALVIFGKFFGLPIPLTLIELKDSMAKISAFKEEKLHQAQAVFEVTVGGSIRILYIGRGPPSGLWSIRFTVW
ncbi:hypothetical protein [Dehalobacterium formicoaceticum]|uniref:Uncharacterized protein n=1 Tax=Dehalobacterium formicoaceticum TaxID=51515 RepID=A0ABT1Y835_9FIRM|nr:hypothetical protein [Dehalobacterium formicoaceticum]MCR6547052.1 hypothetical protein [Dehalobacterium formicoaceticum]